jgi:hypothetical protein
VDFLTVVIYLILVLAAVGLRLARHLALAT